MRGGARAGAAALVAFLAALALAACGGSGATSTSTAGTTSPPPPATSTPTTTAPTTPRPAAKTRSPKPPPAAKPVPPPALVKQAAKAAPFLVPKGDNSIPTYGSEASGSEQAEATAALSGYLAARAAGDWARACSLMSASVAKQLALLAGEAGGSRPSCEAAYAKLSERAPAAERADPLTHGLTALRVESPHAFALFYGPHEQQYMMPMISEAGGWKVAQIAPVPWPVGAP